jgi:hypothetical protein
MEPQSRRLSALLGGQAAIGFLALLPSNHIPNILFPQHPIEVREISVHCIVQTLAQ